MKCEFCESENTVKNGFVRGKQRYLCKACGKTFTLEDGRKNNVASELIFDLLCCVERMDNVDSREEVVGVFSRCFGVSRRTVNRWIKRRERYAQLNGVIWECRSAFYFDEGFIDRRKGFLCASINLDDNANAVIIVQRKN